jgi:hypothetical protein
MYPLKHRSFDHLRSDFALVPRRRSQRPTQSPAALWAPLSARARKSKSVVVCASRMWRVHTKRLWKTMPSRSAAAVTRFLQDALGVAELEGKARGACHRSRPLGRLSEVPASRGSSTAASSSSYIEPGRQSSVPETGRGSNADPDLNGHGRLP